MRSGIAAHPSTLQPCAVQISPAAQHSHVIAHIDSPGAHTSGSQLPSTQEVQRPAQAGMQSLGSHW